MYPMPHSGSLVTEIDIRTAFNTIVLFGHAKGLEKSSSRSRY